MNLSSRPERERESRILPLAILASLAVHLLVFFLYNGAGQIAMLLHLPHPRPRPTPTPEFVTTSQAITIDKIPKPAPVPPPQRAAPPPSRPVVPQPPRQTVVDRPVAVPASPPPERKREIARVVPKKPPASTPAPTPRRVAQAQPEHQQQQPQKLDPTKIAQLEQNFSQTIAQARSDTNPLRVALATPAAPKRYHMQFEGALGKLHHGEGHYWPIQQGWLDQGNHCYYMYYDFMYEDGTPENGSVPWPVCFSAGRDPFSNPEINRLERTPLPGPPPGWKPAPGIQIGKALRPLFPGSSGSN